jgi:hypothetical protein
MTANWPYLLALASFPLLVGLGGLVVLIAVFSYPVRRWLIAYEQAHAAMQRGLELPPRSHGASSTPRSGIDATATPRATGARCQMPRRSGLAAR